MNASLSTEIFQVLLVGSAHGVINELVQLLYVKRWISHTDAVLELQKSFAFRCGIRVLK